jgi:hypothetical protein
MPVRYITVTPVTNLFKPATRSFGDIAIIGTVQTQDENPLTNEEIDQLTVGLADSDLELLTSKIQSKYSEYSKTDIEAFYTAQSITNVSEFKAKGVNFFTSRKAEGLENTPIPITNPDDVRYQENQGNGQAVDSFFWFKGDLGKSIRKAFEQTPGPVKVCGIRLSTGSTALDTALAEVAKLNVQIVVLANTPLRVPSSSGEAPPGKAQIETLASHVNTVSKNGGDGKERIGVAMLGKDETSTTIVTSNMSIDRMVMVAHKSDEDAAAAVAGAIAGYEPHISLLLKQVTIGMDELFSDGEIDAFNDARINWLTDPVLLPGKGLFMGEGYTLGTDLPYIDIVRTVDDISFRLKAALIRSIGNLRVSRSGLRALVSQMTAILEPLRQNEVIEAYDVFIPLLVLLDKDPSSLTDAERQQINNAQNDRTVGAIVSVDYAGAIHRLNITLKFE